MKEYVFFWKREEGNGYLSNWQISFFKVDGITFNCVEQYMMYHKAMFFKDTETANKILKETQPWKHKDLGRQVKNFNQQTWDSVCKEIVFEGCKQKFEQNPYLKNLLLSTESKPIVEASPVDTIWGIGLSEDNANIFDESKWRGKNYLGEVLMRVRQYFFEKMSQNES